MPTSEYTVTLHRNGDPDFPYRVTVTAASKAAASTAALAEHESADGDYTVASVTKL